MASAAVHLMPVVFIKILTLRPVDYGVTPVTPVTLDACFEAPAHGTYQQALLRFPLTFGSFI